MGDRGNAPDGEGLGSGQAGESGVSFDEEKIEAGPGVPTGDQRPTNEEGDETVSESGEGAELHVPEKEQ